MTTTVIIKAHCADDKEVKILVRNGEAVVEDTTIQDNEEHELVVYGSREVSVREVLK